MSRSYSFKPELKKRISKPRTDRKVVLSDFEIEFIELNIGPNIRLRV